MGNHFSWETDGGEIKAITRDLGHAEKIAQLDRRQVNFTVPFDSMLILPRPVGEVRKLGILPSGSTPRFFGFFATDQNVWNAPYLSVDASD